jgi:hypothetical protein
MGPLAGELVAGPASANTARPCFAGTPHGLASSTRLAPARSRDFVLGLGLWIDPSLSVASKQSLG